MVSQSWLPAKKVLAAVQETCCSTKLANGSQPLVGWNSPYCGTCGEDIAV